MPKMISNVVGKVSNISLAHESGLMALHEAIVNSLQAIEAGQKRETTLKGEILIEVRRDELAPLNVDGLKPIRDVVITDNGIGFTVKNYESFQTADSTYKQNLGGKGIGRFLWLKVFEHAEIRSVFKDLKDQQLYNRSFSFNLNDKDPIADKRRVPLINGDARPTGSSIKLCNLRPEYADPFTSSLEELADAIIEHHIHFLVDGNCPTIILREADTDSSTHQYNLNNRFWNEFLLDRDANSIALGSGHHAYIFELAFLKIKNEGRKTRHAILYSANRRVVLSHPLGPLIPDLIKPLQLINGPMFDVLVLVSGSYLDQHVNGERTRLNIPVKKATTKLGRPALTLDEIEEEVVQQTNEHLAEFLVDIRQEKHAQIRQFVVDSAPQYRSLLNYTDRLDKIKPGLTGDKLDIELHKIRNELVVETKQELGRILDASDALAPNTEDFTRDLNKLMGRINDVNQTNLVDYVVQRKMILMLFERVLKIGANNAHEYEERIHNIIFPMDKDSDQVQYKDHNLWLIDERLAYHNFLRSDQPLTTNDKNSPRPDIVVGFERNLLYTDREEAPYDSFTIIEFKRPMRDDYGKEDDPIAQVQRYLAYIQTGEATTNDDRPINPTGAKFYCYIICDLTKKIRNFAKDRGFTESRDGEGYFWYNPNYHAYFELISFAKLVKDSKQRNQILFDKLGIGHA
ncbi:ATP-binding protein [Hymenobacter cheonanensis]|uniref:ATP-binding protein n=1 Tax=Hymenobacter sp. CA2-7 TaxID=3063993 RepID=UPI002712D4AA|nr:ATP-binding protein [Hymenobacter sp. CA2-7]MDO7884261.1 ATP-binding protein [Hymenobacter sp. CA2-7]